jgi:hypothetical protein
MPRESITRNRPLLPSPRRQPASSQATAVPPRPRSDFASRRDGPQPVSPAALPPENPWSRPAPFVPSGGAQVGGSQAKTCARLLPYHQLATVTLTPQEAQMTTCSISWEDFAQLREPVLVQTGAFHHVFEYALLSTYWLRCQQNPMTCLPLKATDILRITQVAC